MKTGKKMGRLIGFDKEAALQTAMLLFWDRDNEGTAMAGPNSRQGSQALEQPILERVMRALFDNTVAFLSIASHDPNCGLGPQGSKEGEYVGRQQFWFLCSRKMAAARHFRPTLNVVAALNPLSRRDVDLPGKASDCAGRTHKFTFCKVKRRLSAFVVHAERRGNCLSHPVESDISQQFIPGKAAV
jgi:hypothetical protein